MSLLINEEPCDHLSISLDIGGNIGWYTGFFTALGCQVISVEAQGFATVLLNSTIKASHIDKSTCNDVWHRAVAGDSLGFVRMLGNTEGHGNSHRIVEGEERLPKVLVKGSTVYDIVQNSYICKHILSAKREVNDDEDSDFDWEGLEYGTLGLFQLDRWRTDLNGVV